eukprot:GHUV01041336.1.p2 GENE.GHUV01041336.1~~GHUV01041336.1.p2  ORF type:complete len:121 (-),score=28.66 GHUV01041336.1:15-377(-)
MIGDWGIGAETDQLEPLCTVICGDDDQACKQQRPLQALSCPTTGIPYKGRTLGARNGPAAALPQRSSTCLSISAVRASSRAMSPSSIDVSAMISCQLAPPAHASTRPTHRSSSSNNLHHT